MDDLGPEIGERWRYRHPAGSYVIVVNVKEGFVYYQLDLSDSRVTFCEKLLTWNLIFESEPVTN